MVPAETPEIIGDTAAVAGLALAVIALLSTVLGLLWKAFKIHSDMQAVVAEMRPNHGSSLRDQIDAVRGITESNAQAIASHVAISEAAKQDFDKTMADFDRNNSESHAAIHKRIDGLFVLLAGPNTASARRVADLHHAQREGEPNG